MNIMLDARTGRDPTGTSKLRASFRATGRVHLGQMRAAIRSGLIDHDVLALRRSNLPVMIDEATRLQAFHEWLRVLVGQYLVTRWPDPFIARAWDAGHVQALQDTLGPATTQAAPGVGPSALQRRAYQELTGIGAAIVQQVSRTAAIALATKAKPLKAASMVRVAFDKIATDRVNALANTLVVGTFNRAKLETYRAAGVDKIGIIPETEPKPHSDARVTRDAWGPAAWAASAAARKGSGEETAKLGRYNLRARKIGEAKRKGRAGTNPRYSGRAKAMQRMAAAAGFTEPTHVWSISHESPEHQYTRAHSGTAGSMEEAKTAAEAAAAHLTNLYQDARGRKPKLPEPDADGDEGDVEIEFVPEPWTELLLASLTAGDDKVCFRCEDIAEDAPYTLDEALELLPAHANCRCALVPWTGINPNPDLRDWRTVDVGWTEEARAAARLARRRNAHNIHSTEGRAWFGKSKVVGKHGQPLVVYHGTTAPEDFGEFSVGEPQESREEDQYYRTGSGNDPSTFLGSHFAEDPAISNMFAGGLYGERQGRGEHGRVYPVYLKINNPYETTEDDMQTAMLQEDYNHPDVEQAAIDRFDGDDEDEAFAKYERDPYFRAEVNRAALNYGQQNDGEPDASLAQEMASRFRAKLQEQGYDGIHYHNRGEGGWAWIAFEPEQIKSAIGSAFTSKPDIRDFTPAQWAEELHPRAWHGRWSSKGGKESPYARWYREHPRVMPSATGPAQQELWPGKFPPIPDPVDVMTLPDFEKAKIDINPGTKNDPEKAGKFLKTWNERVQEAPEEFRDEFLGGIKATMKINYDEYANSVELSGSLLNDAGRSIGQYTRIIDFERNRAVSDYLSINSSQQGKDIGKRVLAANVAMYQKLGIDEVEVHANIDVGGYAWAKYGYVPTDSSWDVLRNDLSDKIGGGEGYEPESWDAMTDSEQERVEKAWARETFDEFYNSEVENWRDQGGDLAEAKKELADKDEPLALNDVIKYAITIGEGDDVKGQMLGPFMSEKGLSVESILHWASFTYDDRRGDGSEDADVDVNWGAVDEKNLLTEEQRGDIESILVEAFNKQAEHDRGWIDEPDYLRENVESSQHDYWESMRDRDRFRWAQDHDKVPTREPEGEDLGADTGRLRELVDDSDPKAIWDIADSKHGKNLLLGTDWNGVLDLNDSDSMSRFNAYVSKKK